MPRTAQLKQVSSIPITWLSESKLKLSLLLRHEAKRSGKEQEALEYLLQDKLTPSHLISEFPNLSDPDREVLQNASDDYLRCLLAKSISEVYRKLTPKYRNEAARKQFFKKLVKIAESTYLTPSNDGLHGVLSPSEPDDVTLWVNSEFQRLLGGKVDLSNEFTSRLSAARSEFRASLRQLESAIGVTWQESERYQSLLSLSSFFPPGVCEDETSWRWGAQWYPRRGLLNINPQLLFFDVLRKGLIIRESAILLSPIILDEMEHAPRVLCEQAEYFSYKLLERKNDRDFWAEARHGLRQQTRLRGLDLIDFFQFYEMMVGDSLYREVWSRLKEFGKIRITVADYYIIFNTLAARPVTQSFDKNEHRLLGLLSKRPDVKAGEAARLLHVSIPTAMKAIRDLSTKAGLRFTVIANMRKLGLQESLLLLNSKRQAEALRVLSRFPYCRQVFRTYGSYDLFSVLDVPERHNDFVRELVGLMSEKGLITNHRLYELQHDFQSVNFDRYEVGSGRWNIHWDSWGIGLRESLSKGEGVVLESPSDVSRFRFDKLDLRILSNLQIDCRTPFSTMARSLDVSGAYVGKKVDRMLKENVFRYAIWPLKIGAEDWGIISLACKKEVASTFAKYLAWLPAWRGGLIKGDTEGLLAIVWAPSGELKQLFKAIDDRLIRNGYAQSDCLNSIGEWIIARWLPVESYPWDLCRDDGEWIFDEKRYASLVT